MGMKLHPIFVFIKPFTCYIILLEYVIIGIIIVVYHHN